MCRPRAPPDWLCLGPVCQSALVVLGSVDPPGSGQVRAWTLAWSLGRRHRGSSLKVCPVPTAPRPAEGLCRHSPRWASGLVLFPGPRLLRVVHTQAVRPHWMPCRSLTLLSFLPQEPEEEADDAAGNPEPAAGGQRDREPPGFREVGRPSGGGGASSWKGSVGGGRVFGPPALVGWVVHVAVPPHGKTAKTQLESSFEAGPGL